MEMALYDVTSGEHKRSQKIKVSAAGNFTKQVCIRVCVFDEEQRAGLHELVAGLHLQEIITFVALYTTLL